MPPGWHSPSQSDGPVGIPAEYMGAVEDRRARSLAGMELARASARSRYLRVVDQVRVLVAEGLPDVLCVGNGGSNEKFADVKDGADATDGVEWRLLERTAQVRFCKTFDGPQTNFALVISKGRARYYPDLYNNKPEEIAACIIHCLTRDDPPPPIPRPVISIGTTILGIMSALFWLIFWLLFGDPRV